MSSKPIWQSFPTLESERLVLREITAADADDLFDIFSDEATMEYWSCRPYTSIVQAQKLIESLTNTTRQEIGIHWAITLRGENRLIGRCGYNEWRKPHRRGEISYIIARHYWGKGIAREALHLILDYGFTEMNLHSVEAGVTPGNNGSTRMLERLGFRLEGHLRESYFAEDHFVDSLIYSLLQRDFCTQGDEGMKG
jgi:ribosomal-protein-alanine N-acetyltransferase